MLPKLLHRGWRKIECSGGFRFGQSAEHAPVDDIDQSRVQMCELIQRGIKSDPFFGFLIGGAIGLARDCRGDVPAAAGGNAIVRVVDQELAHGAAGQRKKVFATADGRSTLLGNAQLELVHD